LHEYWRDVLADAEHRYTEERTETTRAAYLRALKSFSDLVLRNKIPES
jgi:hypothetical protein